MRLRGVWWAGGCVLVGIVLYVCLTPLSVPPGATLYNDKVMHVLTFAFLAIWFGALLPAAVISRVFLFLTLFGFGILIEVLQSFTAFRSAEFGDVVADGVGAMLGIALLYAGLMQWPRFVESRILRLTPR